MALPVDDLVVDVVFPFATRALPADHGQALALALCRELDWLQGEPQAAIHPIKGVIAGTDPVMLSRRARLALRVNGSRLPALQALGGSTLRVANHPVRLGVPAARGLSPHATLYAHKVAADSADEPAFMREVARELEELEITGHAVCGLHQQLRVSGRTVDAFSLMLHGLDARASLRLQQRGLGPHRLLGCGVFVPHKSAAAVGAPAD